MHNEICISLGCQNFKVSITKRDLINDLFLKFLTGIYDINFKWLSSFLHEFLPKEQNFRVSITKTNMSGIYDIDFS